MMRNVMMVCVLAVVARTGGASAETAVSFTHDGKPVDPLCLANADLKDGATLSLADCLEGVVLPEKDARYVKDNGTVGVNFGYGGAVSGYAQYRVLGKIDDRIGLLLNSGDGGSGDFSTVFTVTSVGDTLTVDRVYASGDRCNRGVRSASIVDEKITYVTNMTPADFVTLPFGAKANQNQMGTSDTLLDCAVCCVATASYSDGVLKEVAFNEGALEAVNPNEPEGSPQACFNNLMKLNMTHGSTSFNASDFKTFGREIGHTCLGWMEGEPAPQ